MQFIREGPDIPERLLQAHEDGRVVFLRRRHLISCSFAWLFRASPEVVHGTCSYTQCSATSGNKVGQFDTAIGLLEADIVGGREVVRRALASILTPDLSSAKATATHEAVLSLAMP